MPISIPTHFSEAALIFLQELEEHFTKVDETITQLLDTPGGQQKGISVELAKDLSERFHLIRGGAGFLTLEDLKVMATEAEKFFRNGEFAASPERTLEILQRSKLQMKLYVGELRALLAGLAADK